MQWYVTSRDDASFYKILDEDRSRGMQESLEHIRAPKPESQLGSVEAREHQQRIKLTENRILGARMYNLPGAPAPLFDGDERDRV